MRNLAHFNVVDLKYYYYSAGTKVGYCNANQHSRLFFVVTSTCIYLR